MAITFQICLSNTARVHVMDNAHLMDTQRGFIPASDVVQGDLIRNISEEPRREVVAPPTVS